MVTEQQWFASAPVVKIFGLVAGGWQNIQASGETGRKFSQEKT